MSTFAELRIAVREPGRVEQRVACPRCAKHDRDDTLGVNTRSGAFHCFRCGWSGRAGTGETQPPVPIACCVDSRQAERKRKRLNDTWASCVPLNDVAAAPVQRYLLSRGLAGLLSQDCPHNLRAHPALKYFDEEGREVGIFAAMVGLLQSLGGRGATLHLTYLNRDGTKAPVSSPKKLLPPAARGATRGGAIQLYAPDKGVLGIAEGIENALSLRSMLGFPCWSTYCAQNLATIALPTGLQLLHIVIDVDASGTGAAAARTLTARAQRQGIDVRHVIPEGAGPRDLNDELRRRIN